MRVWRDPEGRGPYGIAATPSGDIYYVSLAGSHLARVDRETGAATIIEPPTAGQGARRVWADRSGNLWISEWNGGQLSRYTPATGAWRSWRPEGERPRVYAVYVDDRDIVWITDFGANATLSFDPADRALDALSGQRRQCQCPPDSRRRPGWVYLPESGLDRIMVVRTGREGDRSWPPRWGAACAAGGAPPLAAARPSERRGRARLPPRNASPATRSSPAETRRRGRRCTASSAGRSPPIPASIIRRRCAACAARNARWTPALLDRFLADPEAVVPGPRWAFVGHG